MADLSPPLLTFSPEARAGSALGALDPPTLRRLAGYAQ